MKTILWHLETGACGCDLEGEIEVEDSTPEEDIEDYDKEDMWNRLSLTWSIKTAER